MTTHWSGPDCGACSPTSPGWKWEFCGRLRPDLVLMDARMPDLDGLAATRAIKQASPDTHVILITVYESRAYIEEALKSGVSGYILKGTSRRDIIQAVRQALRGATVLPSDLAHDRLRRVAGETGGEAAKPQEAERDRGDYRVQSSPP